MSESQFRNRLEVNLKRSTSLAESFKLLESIVIWKFGRIAACVKLFANQIRFFNYSF